MTKGGVTRFASVMAGVALMGTVVAAGARTASADPFPVQCLDVAGNVYSTVGGADAVTWTLSGVGTCIGDASNPPYLVTISGTGTSTGRGYCTGDPAVTNLVFSVHVSLVSTGGSASFNLNEIWTATPSLGMVTIPFTVGGAATGTGTMFTHIYGQCPGTQGSSAAATYDWTENL